MTAGDDPDYLLTVMANYCPRERREHTTFRRYQTSGITGPEMKDHSGPDWPLKVTEPTCG
jgi:hypothetical protein